MLGLNGKPCSIYEALHPDELVQFLTGIEGESFGHIEELAFVFRIRQPVDEIFAPVPGGISVI